MWLLKTSNPEEHKTVQSLMSGDTSHLRQIRLPSKIFHILQCEFHVEGITLEDVCRYMGIKRTNGNRTRSKNREGSPPRLRLEIELHWRLL